MTDPAQLLELAGLAASSPEPADGLLAELADCPDIDTLSRRLKRPARELRQALSALELTGRVERLPGGRYGARVEVMRRSR